MAFENFKPLIWSKKIQHELGKFTVYKNDCDFKYEGEAGRGKTVKILGVGRPTIKSYTPNTDIESPEQPADTSVYLAIDLYKYFNYIVDDVDKAQAIEGLMEEYSKETTRALAEDEDSYIAEQLATSAGYKTNPTAISNNEEAQQIVDQLFIQLWNNGVSFKDDVTLYVTPWFYSKFKNQLIELKTDNDKLVANGVVGMYNGAKVKLTNNAYTDGSSDCIVLKTSKAYAFCDGINELEAYRPEKRFADAIKGLNTYGGKMVRPKECAVAFVHAGS